MGWSKIGLLTSSLEKIDKFILNYNVELHRGHLNMTKKA